MFTKSFKLAVISSLISSVTFANPTSPKIIINPNTTDVATYWTAERMRDATPMDLPQANPQRVVELSTKELMAKFGDLKPQLTDAAPPTAHIQPVNHYLFMPRLPVASHSLHNAGTLKEQFSSSQLVPLTADQVYPYSTVGKLFFTTPSGNKTCSASVIANRLILTAGHCVHNGNGSASGYYTNWTFVPAYHNGNAPFSTWTVSAFVASAPWYSGGGTVPNASDLAILQVNDQTIGGTVQSIGSVVGKLGTQTLSTIPNHAHMLGFPGNLDSGQLMHQVTAQSALAVAPNNAEYGSNMSTGAGGGPWIQNFGVASAGETGGTNPGRNLVIGVTSYGYNNTTSLGNGSSILDSNFTTIYNSMCSNEAGNC